MSFINIVRNASLEDPLAKMSPTMLNRLRNPPTSTLQIISPGVKHSITTYLALEHASRDAYEKVIRSTRRNFSTADGVETCLRFGAVEDLIASHTGIEPVEHDMCPNSCLAFTGPFEDLERCPTCDMSRWNELKLHASHGRVKVAAKTFITLPLGPQLQALYRDPDGARAMSYLQTRAQEIVDEYCRTQKIPLIDDIITGWDFLGAYLDGDIQDSDIVVMASIDGAQLYEDKESDCWIVIWIVINLSPATRYRKMHVIPGAFIPGPKNIDFFMVVSLHHLSALQKEGLTVWDAARDHLFRASIYFIFATGK